MDSADDLVLFSGNANPALTASICRYLKQDLGPALVSQFSDGETRVELRKSIRGRAVFVVQSTCYPANQHLMEALVIVDACRRASAKTITLVMPYFGYARQERKSAARTPITAKLIAELMEVAGVHRLLTLELHNSAIQGFFNVPVDHLFIRPVFHAALADSCANTVVVSPDAGGVERARALAKQMGCGIAVVDKRRDQPNESRVMHVVGDVHGKHCLIVDDIIDTAGTLINAASALRDHGATEIRAAATHAVLSGSAVSRLAESDLVELVVSDSIPLGDEARKCSKIRQVSVAPLLGEAILRIHQQKSVSSLFERKDQQCPS